MWQQSDDSPTGVDRQAQFKNMVVYWADNLWDNLEQHQVGCPIDTMNFERMVTLHCNHLAGAILKWKYRSVLKDPKFQKSSAQLVQEHNLLEYHERRPVHFRTSMGSLVKVNVPYWTSSEGWGIHPTLVRLGCSRELTPLAARDIAHEVTHNTPSKKHTRISLIMEGGSTTRSSYVKPDHSEQMRSH